MPQRTSDSDQRIADLIGEAQQYSNPTNQNPEPPSITYPPSGVIESEYELYEVVEEGGDLPDRLPRPPWFEPVHHRDDREIPPGGIDTDVPILEDEEEFAEPSAPETALIEAYGLDAFAYYAPFHFYQRWSWGIYIRDYGIAHLASQFLGRRVLKPSDNWVLRCAYWLLLEHEYFHFQTEVAATRYEMLTGDKVAYEHLFHDRHAFLLEESMANARAHRSLDDHEDAVLTFSRIQQFRGFAASWMKRQPAGYCDFDKWCRTNSAMQKGRAELTRRLHEISWSLRHRRHTISSDVLRPYENAEYSRVPIVQVHDSRVPWLKFARLFPKYQGIQIVVHTREHPPAHIHVEFLSGAKMVRLEWPSLNPLGRETLSRREEKALHAYLKKFGLEIEDKVQKVYAQPTELQTA